MRRLLGQHRPVASGFRVDQLHAGRQLLADIEALGALLVIPMVAVPVRPMAWSLWRALVAVWLAAAYVLLAVDDAVGATRSQTQVRAARLQGHTQSLHKMTNCTVGSRPHAMCQARTLAWRRAFS
jgi:hypothetical protein